MRRLKDRRRAQAGTTLVELLVSLTIASMALALIVGVLSTGLLNATIAKRNTAAQAAMQYEVEAIAASSFSTSAAQYSDCFATESPSSPAAAAAYQGSCPSGAFSLRADATWQWLPGSSTVQVWTISIATVPSGSAIGQSVTVYKVNR
jgi:type II secretory pathway pseudopilin PulG